MSDPSYYYNRSNSQSYYKQTHIRNLGYFVVIFHFIDYETSWKVIIEVGENLEYYEGVLSFVFMVNSDDLNGA